MRFTPARSISFQISKIFRRSYSFLDSFCKKDDNKVGNEASVSVQLENVSEWQEVSPEKKKKN